MNNKVTAQVETITPAMARDIIDNHNNGNRRHSGVNISKLVQAFTTGTWMLNGESIIFDDSGHLLNGQHRMYACIEANLPFDTVVARGVSKEAFKTMDTGKNRTAGDVLGIDGADSKHSPKLAKIINRYEGFKAKRITNPIKMSNTEILELYRASDTTYEDALDIGKDYYNHNPIISDVHWAVAFLALQNEDKGIEYLDALRDTLDDVKLVTTHLIMVKKMSRLKEGRTWVAILNGYNFYATNTFPKELVSTTRKEARANLVGITYPTAD